MRYDEYIAAVRREGEALGAAGRRGLSPAVPCCPPWTVARLVGHTGRVHSHAT